MPMKNKGIKKLALSVFPAVCALAIFFAMLPAAGAASVTESATVLPSAKNAKAGVTVSFSQKDFTANITDGAKLQGIMITALPDKAAGTLKLSGKALSRGETVTYDELSKLTFVPASAKETLTSFSFVPVFKNGAGGTVTLKINLSNKINKAPTAASSKFETIRSVMLVGLFNASDADGDALSYKLLTSPKRGTVSMSSGRIFIYSPEDGYTGNDSFTYCAVDSYGNLSKTAKVNVKVQKPKDKTVFADLEGSYACLPAVRLAEQGVFSGEKIGNTLFFYPEKTVSRGEFIAMALTAAGLADNLQSVKDTGFTDDESIPSWQKAYIAQAMDEGLIQGYPSVGGGREIRASQTITRSDAAVIIDALLEPAAQDTAAVSSFSDASLVPAWARQPIANLESTGIISGTSDAGLMPAEPLTRAQAAVLLYRAMEYKEANEPKGIFSWFK